MTRIQLHGPVTVDAMAPIPRTVLDRLRELLSAGVDARPDAHRPNFYTVSDQDRSTYFYISPVSAKVWVLESRLAKSSHETAHAVAHSA
jgi:hypothetical protein